MFINTNKSMPYCKTAVTPVPLRWRHNDRDGVSNHQPHDCLLNRSFRCTSNETSKLRVTDLCVGNSPVAGEFPAQRASNVENVPIWWRHHGVSNGVTAVLHKDVAISLKYSWKFSGASRIKLLFPSNALVYFRDKSACKVIVLVSIQVLWNLFAFDH